MKYSNILEEKDFQGIKDRISLLIENREFIDLINNSIYTKEQELIFNDEIKIIDLLIQKENEYIIVDYKTTIAKQKSHEIQVLNYKKAIRDITNSKNIKSYIVYLFEDKSEIVLV
jgi:exodeoxyribonuclease V beta subunit